MSLQNAIAAADCNVPGEAAWHQSCHDAGNDTVLPASTDDSDIDSINNIEGIFPKGCQWRDVQHDGQHKKFWSEEQYEYWHGDVKQWKPDMPSGCSVRGKTASG